jgi:WD40-like Beta Propeller Repeat
VNDGRRRLVSWRWWAAASAVAAALCPATASASPGPPTLNGPIVYSHRFNRGERIFRVGLDRHPTLIVDAAGSYLPVVSPDGRTVALQHCLDTQSFAPDCFIATAPVGGGTPHDLTTEYSSDGYAFDPAWSPVPGVYAFHVATGFSTGGSPDDCCQDIAVSDASGFHVVASTGGWQDWSWSPDGSEFVFVQTDRAADLEIAPSTRDCGGWPCVEPPTRHLAAGADPAWSPRGDLIAFVRNGDVYTIGRDGSGQRRLTHTREWDQLPSWSPDGRSIAFWRVNRKSGDAWVDVIDRAGSPERRVGSTEQDGEGRPSWSPDSRYLTWWGDRIRVAAVDGRSPVRDLGPGRTPSWGRPRCSAIGTAEDDELGGTQSGDVVCAFGGNDRIRPGRGRDVAFGDAGDDTFFLRDGDADSVSCGGGYDTVVADAIDAVTRDCERVER